MDRYVPLHIDPETERAIQASRNSLWDRCARWVQRVSPFLVYYELPHGRASVESQLRSRLQFPRIEWENHAHLVDSACSVLDVVQREMDLPNRHFLPDDPLAIVLIPGYDDLAYDSVRLGINEEFDIKMSAQDLKELLENKNSTVADLVDFVLCRFKGVVRV